MWRFERRKRCRYARCDATSKQMMKRCAIFRSDTDVEDSNLRCIYLFFRLIKPKKHQGDVWYSLSYRASDAFSHKRDCRLYDISHETETNKATTRTYARIPLLPILPLLTLAVDQKSSVTTRNADGIEVFLSQSWPSKGGFNFARVPSFTASFHSQFRRMYIRVLELFITKMRKRRGS